MKFAPFEHFGREQVGWVEADRVIHPIGVVDIFDLITRFDVV